MEIALNFPSISIDPSDDLDTSYEKVIEAFETSEFKVYRPDYLNGLVLSKDFARLFNIYDNDIKYTFFVINTTWNDDKISKILNSFSQTGEKAKTYFYSAYPLPDVLAFINTNSIESFFELEAIRNLKPIAYFGSEIDNMHKYSEILNKLTNKYFNLSVDYNQVTSLKNIETIITQNFRKCDDYEMLYDTDIIYFPYYSMLLFGLYFVDLISKNLKGEIFYKNEQSISEIGVGFSTNNNEMIDVMAHPVEKVFKFFFYGKDNSIINWYYDLRYSLQNMPKN